MKTEIFNHLSLPALNLPDEFVLMLVNPKVSAFGQGSPLIEYIRKHKALYTILEKALSELDEYKSGLEKLINGLGWTNFRDRWASIYLYKVLYGAFPHKADLKLVESLRDFEKRFQFIEQTGPSRIYLLGFYLEFANRKLLDQGELQTLGPPRGLDGFLKERGLKTDRPDWLILLVWHMELYFGEDMLRNLLIEEKKFEEIYAMMPTEQRKQLVYNLLAYGKSINEQGPFVFNHI